MPSFSSQPLRKPGLVRPKSKQRPDSTRPCVVQSLLSLSSRGNLSEALSYLDPLAQRGIRLSSSAFVHLLRLCAKANSLKGGKCIHLHLKNTGFKRPTTIVANHLIGMYFKCGHEIDARKVFDKMSVRNLYSWNHMLAGYAKLGNVYQARKLFDGMTEKDVVSWNTMVLAYAKKGCFNEVVGLYRDFRRLEMGLNEFSFSGVLILCVKLRELQLTKQVHGQVLAVGFLSNVVLSSSIIDAYAKCGEMGCARKLFDEMLVKDILAWTTMVSGYAKWGDMNLASELFHQMPEKNPVSWTALISGYARNGLGHEALDYFTKMMMFRIHPDQYTFSSCLCACAGIAALKHGKQVHAYMIRTNFRCNTIVVSSLIDMYSKCGMLEAGCRVFHLMGNKQDVVLWNTMISSLAQHGHGEKAMQMFNDMVNSGLKPDRITFIVILSTCSHSGLAREGHQFFKAMTYDHSVLPDQEHYAWLIELLGGAGCFNELVNELEKMSCKPDDRVWNALLGVCKIHGSIELGRKVGEHVMELDHQSCAAHECLASLYAFLGKWESVEKVREELEERLVKKERAISWCDIENKVHSFVADHIH
ncbi:pentatricopeptide repeat-containing protein At2g21090-like [Cucurbita maxima]|uniref:Pentatricopeptide repeat-containing protein At2g21090-like n=1 Tax=Cucurbita maxima TaxID=3661 RepID=A0A6J1IEE4_CUCMA|nr:pentatricopeptide repeat-containing protein At2g21090-like [Cucurbita maxima]XP_022973380.1 pentatricopeptide repeat-containing protein At2g21090-like [Cucurbita maxima]